MSDLSMQGKVVLIVGAGRWPGPLLAQAYARRGALVAVNDLSPILLDPICALEKNLPGKIKACVADATRGMPLRAMLEEVQEDWGNIEILINNPRVLSQTPMLEMDEWDWQRTIEMNLNGPFLVTQLVSRGMRELGHGTIINIIDACRGRQEPGRAAYAASQAGLLAFSQAAALELMTYNIRVYSFCPDDEVLHNLDSKNQPEYRLTGAQDSEEALVKLAISLCDPDMDHPTAKTFRISRAGYEAQE